VPGGVAVLTGIIATGGVTPSAFADPGAGVRWGLPAARLVGDLAGSLALGLLVLAAVLPARSDGLRVEGPGWLARPAVPAAVRGGCAAAVVWTLALLARLILQYAAATGQGLSAPGLGTQLASYVTQVDAGRWAAAAVVAAGLVAIVAAGTSGAGTAAGLAVLALAALAALTLSDAAGAPGRSPIMTLLLWLHVAAAALVVGCLGGLLLLQSGVRGAVPVPAASLARPVVWALALVGGTGVASAGLAFAARPGTVATCALLAIKAAALAALGFLAWRARGRWPLPTALAVGAIAVGIAVALAVAS
jgi:hypothetical protein